MKIKKILALSIVTVLMIVNFSYADNTKLTYKEASKIAINNNLKLERTKTTIQDIDKSLESGTGLPEYTYQLDPVADISATHGMYEMQSNLDVQKNMKEAQEEAILLGLKNLFYNIENLEKSSKLLQEEIVLKRTEWNMEFIKKSLGLVSEIDFKNTQTELDKVSNSIKENKLDLDNAYKNLDHILGTKNNKKIEYITGKVNMLDKSKFPLNSMVGRATSSAPTIFAMSKNIRMLELKMKLGLFDNSLTSLPENYQRKSVKMMDIDRRDTKENLENSVIETYNNLLKMEETLKNLDFDIKNLEKQKENTSLMVKVGSQTKFQLDTIEMTLKKTKLEREKLLKNYDILKSRYEKPYLLAI